MLSRHAHVVPARITRRAARSSGIHINISFILITEWLIDRKWVQKDWHQKSTAIRARIDEAIKGTSLMSIASNVILPDMPDDAQITALLSGAYINYFHCLAIVEILKVMHRQPNRSIGRVAGV